MIKEFLNIHILDYNGVFLAIDAATLSVFELNEKMKEYLLGNEVDIQDKKILEEELIDLLKKGYFIDSGKPKSVEGILNCYNISLQNTLECPLNCSYCFSKKIKSDPRIMTKQTAHDTLQFIFQTFDEKADSFEIYFTSGGEPLSNFPIIKQVYEEGSELSATYKKRFKTGFTTNSVLLDDEKLEYLEDAQIGMMMSVDGTEEDHNRNRIFYNGEGTYKNVLEALEKLKSSDNAYLNNTQALAVLTPDKGSYIELLKYLVDIGFRKVNMKLARNTDMNNPLITKDMLEEVKEKYRDLVEFLTDEILENRWKYVIPVMDQNNMLGQIVINMILRKKVLYRCDAGKSKFSILPNGDIYPCDFMSTLPETKMGNVYTGIDFDKREDWKELTCLELEECKDCWARYVCAGTCYYSRHINGNKPDQIECEMMKFLMERAAEMIYRIRRDDVGKLRHLIKLVKNVKVNSHDE